MRTGCGNPRRAVEHRRHYALRSRGKRRNRQLQRRGGARPRHRHHIGRCGRRGPRRPPLRPAADGLARRLPDRARDLRGAQRQLGYPRTGAWDRAGETDLLGMNEERKIETEEVDSVAPPPRARVTDTFERKRDYLAGFLSGEQDEEEEAGGPGGDLQASVVEALKSVYDPEIPVDIY